MSVGKAHAPFDLSANYDFLNPPCLRLYPKKMLMVGVAVIMQTTPTIPFAAVD